MLKGLVKKRVAKSQCQYQTEGRLTIWNRLGEAVSLSHRIHFGRKEGEEKGDCFCQAMTINLECIVVSVVLLDTFYRLVPVLNGA